MLRRPLKTPGIPCRLSTPQVSCNLSEASLLVHTEFSIYNGPKVA